MPTVFKVNHKYTGNEGRHIWVCLSICEGYTWMMCINPVMTEPNGSTPGFIYKMSDIDHWTEVVDPRREFFNACKDTRGGTYYTGPFPEKGCADYNGSPNRYGVLELIHHSDTKVESIFHLVKK